LKQWSFLNNKKDIEHFWQKRRLPEGLSGILKKVKKTPLTGGRKDGNIIKLSQRDTLLTQAQEKSS